MKKPKVTFVMPSINDEFIGKSIESILAQSLPEWELLLFNNKEGRKVNIPDDDRITVIDTGGWNIMKCCNEAHKIAKSDIILHQGDDDLSMPDRALISFHSLSSSNATLLAGSYIAFQNPPFKLAYIYCPAPFTYGEYKIGGNRIPLCSSAYRISAAPEYREDFPLLHDFLFSMDFMRSGTLCIDFTATPLLWYRIHQGSLTRFKQTESGMAATKEEAMRMRKLYNDDTIRSKYIKQIEEKGFSKVLS